MTNNNTTQGKKPRISRRTFLATTGAASTTGLAGCLFGFDQGGSQGGTKSGQNAVELTFWHQESVPHRVEVFKRFIDKFNRENDGIRVSQQPQSWDAVFGKLTSALNTGNEPDFMFSLPAFTMTFQSQGALVDVGEIVDTVDKDRSLFDNTVTPFRYDGGTWGVPMWDMVFLTHYRTDKYGGQSWSPRNWQEWLKDASNVTNQDQSKYGIVLPANKNLWTTENLYTLMIENDAYVYGPDGKIMFDTEETVETLDFYKRMFNQASPPEATAWDWAEWEQALLRDTGYSTNGFSSWVRSLQATPLADKFGAIQQPPPREGMPSRSIHYVNNIMVFNEKKKNAIGTFIEWLHRPENYGAWLAETEPTLYLPVTETGKNAKSFWDHELIQRYRGMVQTQFEALPRASIYGFRDIHTKNNLYIPSVGTLEGSHALAEVVQQLVVRDKSPEEAASWGQNHLENVLGVGPSKKLKGQT
ncbi:ABC transporter substrate-binding protein [Haladaptatus salinisoli]|uniref:ABC transporter substrate-binding protein n=1 Tax=Haladaptatus salinisoli TaxID=2884876 RepID=UPI001D09DAE4|nr:extracellular solute-binding protein [Haladaptatus salinisoli]